MNQSLSKAFSPLVTLYYKAFDYNKYLAGTGFAAFITLGLFFLMVALINLGDNSIPTDNSRKLGDVIMPERDIDTLFDNVEKPDEPEEQPEDIAQPELDLAPLAGVDVSVPKPKANFAGGGSFLEMENTYPYLKSHLFILEELKREELWDMQLFLLLLLRLEQLKTLSPLRVCVEIQLIPKLFIDHVLYLTQLLLEQH